MEHGQPGHSEQGARLPRCTSSPLPSPGCLTRALLPHDGADVIHDRIQLVLGEQPRNVACGWIRQWEGQSGSGASLESRRHPLEEDRCI